MTILHTPRPTKLGELAFLEQLEALLGDDTHLWTELNSHTLGSGEECDLLLVAPNIGAFAVEVKAIILDQIEEMGPKTCKIRYPGGVQEKHPLEQARGGMHSLRNYLQKNTSTHYSYPFMKQVVAFPKITFAAFEEAFGESSQLIDQAESSFVFADDLESTEALRHQFQRIYADRRNQPTTEQIDFLIKHLSIDEAVTRKPKPSSADAERARLAIQQIHSASSGGGKKARSSSKRTKVDVEQTARDRAYLGTSDPRVVIFEGAPGTGKTMELMRLALEHAKQGRKALFTCYNLVLASFLEGMLAHEDVDDALTSHIDIIPVDRLRSLASEDSETMADLYDTVCIDESQDLKEGAFDNIRLVAKEDAHWFLSDGPGQELYSDGTTAPSLIAVREQAAALGSVVKLNTSRRTANATLQIARSVRDIAPAKERITGWYSTRKIQRRSDQVTLDLEIEALPDPAELIDVRFWTSPPGKHECFVSVLTELLNRLEREQYPRDLAILVARTEKDPFNRDTVRTVLDKMGVPYLDQTVNSNKSVVLPEGYVRLVSHHSARGIEASRVLLLDLGFAFSEPKTEELNNQDRAKLYIALTRGRLGTTVLCGPLERERPYVSFLVESVREYERLMNTKA